MMKTMWDRYNLLKFICFILFIVLPLFLTKLQTYSQNSFRNEKCKIELTRMDDSSIPANYEIINGGKINSYKVFNYTLPVNSRIRITVYDNLGKEMAVILDEIETAGNYVLKWDPDNACSGVYFYKMMAAPSDGSGTTFCVVKKLVINTPFEDMLGRRITGY